MVLGGRPVLIVALLAAWALATILAPEAAAKTKTKTFSSGDVSVTFGEPMPFNRIGIQVPRQGRLKDIDVAVRLDHAADSEVEIELHGPGQQPPSALLSAGNGGSGANFGTGPASCAGTPTVFDDEAVASITSGTAPFAGTFGPQEPLSVFDGTKIKGTPAKGPWILSLADEVRPPVSTFAGTLYCVSLTIKYKPL